MVVLVVEDSSTMRQLICMALRKIEGIVLVEAADGKDALNKLSEITPDLLLTDLNMPELDGFALIQEVRGRPAFAKLPILVLTTESDNEKKERARKLGATGFIIKPFNPTGLVDVLRKVAA